MRGKDGGRAGRGGGGGRLRLAVLVGFVCGVGSVSGVFNLDRILDFDR